MSIVQQLSSMLGIAYAEYPTELNVAAIIILLFLLRSLLAFMFSIFKWK